MTASTNPLPERTTLQGVAVLVVEDDYFIADEICSALHAHGAVIVGPVPDSQRALQLLAEHPVRCAVLDINLRGEMVFELAEEIQRRGVPFIFATGYDASIVPAQLADAMRLEKPINLGELLRAVQTAAGGADWHMRR